jgi:membrane protease YdiL (CAAX protease family)
VDFVGGALSAIPMLAGLVVLVRVPWRPFVELLRVVDESVAPLFRGVRLGELAVIAGLAGLGEEMLFRGVIQRALAGWIGGPSGLWIALGVTAVLFGLGHAITRMYFAIAALMGLYLGGLLLATNNLLVPITAHAVYDFLALVYLVRIRTPAEPRE